MSFIRYIKKIEYLDNLIRRKATGNQQQFAKKVGMSRSTLNSYLNEMKLLKFPIKYDRKINSYYYQHDGKFVTSFFQESLSKEEMGTYKAGSAALLIWELPVYKNSMNSFSPIILD
jgi:transcriptional regulator with XRE-family HTH domain